MPDIFKALTSNNSTILLALMVFIEGIVIVYQNKYTRDKTVPKELFDKQSDRFDKLSDIVTTGFAAMRDTQNKTLTIIDERLKR